MTHAEAAVRCEELNRERSERDPPWILREISPGDWHAVVDRNGVPSGDKSGAWKDPYHQGRAVLTCLELLAGH